MTLGFYIVQHLQLMNTMGVANFLPLITRAICFNPTSDQIKALLYYDSRNTPVADNKVLFFCNIDDAK